MAKRKQLYLVHYNNITGEGVQEDNLCPKCDGDGVFVGDYEDGGKDLDISPCEFCNMTGVSVPNKDYKVEACDTEDGPLYRVVKI